MLVGDMSLPGRGHRCRARWPCTTGTWRGGSWSNGITGLWQVSGRSDLTWEDGIRLDLYYVENWSLTSDLLIMWKTLGAVLQARGAY